MSGKRKTGSELIAAERQRQIDMEGWSAKHDDRHRRKELARAAESYLAIHTHPVQAGQRPEPCFDWPWEREWWKPDRSRVRNLVKAGALIAAEIDRLQRRNAPRLRASAVKGKRK